MWFLSGFPLKNVTANKEAIDQWFLLDKLKSSLWKFYGRHHDFVNRYGISESVPRICSTCHKHFPVLSSCMTYHRVCNRLTRRVPLVEQELLTLPDHLSSPPVFCEVCITRYLVLCVCFVDRSLSFCPFSFGHCGIYFKPGFSNVICHGAMSWLEKWLFGLLILLTITVYQATLRLVITSICCIYLYIYIYIYISYPIY